MPTASRISFAAIVSIGTLAACLLPELQTLSGGDTADATVSDVNVADAPIQDGGTADRDAATNDTGSLCANVRYCQTFEDASSPAAVGSVDISGGAVQIVADGPPHGNVLLTTTDPTDAGGVLARINLLLAPNLSSKVIKLALDLKVTGVPSSMGIVSLSANQGASYCNADLNLELQGYTMGWYCASPDAGVVNAASSNAFAPHPSADVWTRIEVTLDLDASSLTARIDGAPTSLTDFPVTLLPALSPTKVSLTMGVILAPVGPARTLRFDNIALDY